MVEDLAVAITDLEREPRQAIVGALSLSLSLSHPKLPKQLPTAKPKLLHPAPPHSGNMAAAAAVAVSSSLSTSLKCIRFRNWSSDPTARISSSSNKFFIKMGLISQTHSTEAFVPVLAQKWRVPRVSAAVAQEEAAVEAAAEEAVEEEVSGGGEGEGGGAVINTKLYFGNLPYHCDSAQLAGIIQEYGEPELVEVLYNKDTGKSRGYAFVTMSSVEDCNAVIKNLDGTEYGGRILRVNFSDKPKPRNQPLYPETEHKLFIGNLAWTVTTESLTQAFQQYGNVVGARVVYDGETGRSRGYAFVSYATRSEMEAALESLNGVEIDGRALRVSLAEGRRQ